MTSDASYAALSDSMAADYLKYGSVRFGCNDRSIKDEDIVRALMVQCDVEDIECVHPMPGNYWIVTFTTAEMTEETTNRCILKGKANPPRVSCEEVYNGDRGICPTKR